MIKKSAFIVLCVMVSIMFVNRAGAQEKSIRIGDTMPGFFLKDIKGKNFYLKDYIGGEKKGKPQAVLFSLCASYCKPCKLEIPELTSLRKRYSEKDLLIFLIALETQEDAQKLVAETKTTLSVLIDKYLIVPKLVGHTGIPFTILIDSDGIVRYMNMSFSEKNAEKVMGDLEHAIKTICSDSSGSSAQ
jgi:cytochrome c biogenesis protein CcmG, thiol:disulfide interchange protein DsbE